MPKLYTVYKGGADDEGGTALEVEVIGGSEQEIGERAELNVRDLNWVAQVAVEDWERLDDVLARVSTAVRS